METKRVVLVSVVFALVIVWCAQASGLSGGDTHTLGAPARGAGRQGPDISVYPDSLQADLMTGMSETQVMTIENTGDADLVWEVNVRAAASDFPRTYMLAAPGSATAAPDGGGATAPERGTGDMWARLANLTDVHILEDTYHGQGSLSDWSLMVADLVARGATVTESYEPITSGLLGGYDVLWTTDCSDTWTAAEISALADWVTDGGGLLLEGDNTSSVLAYNAILTALGAGITYSPDSGTSGTTSKVFAHETTRGVASIYLTSPVAHLSSVVAPATFLVDDMMSVPNTACSSVGLGRVVAAADELFVDSSMGQADNQLFGNQVFDWLVGVQWLWAEPAEGTLVAGGTVDVSVTFDAWSLPGGDYAADLAVTSNDPDEPEVIVPAHLHVTGAPDIAVSDTLLAYGEVFLGTTATDTLTVLNEGSDTLTVSDISSSDPVYSVDVSAFDLGPNESRDVLVSFAPVALDTFPFWLTILSNDPDEGTVYVELTGEGIEAPDIGVAPDSLYADLLTGATETQILTIENTGGSELEWEIGIEFQERTRASRPIGFHASERGGAASSGLPRGSGGGTHESGVRDLGDVLGTYYSFPVANFGMTWAGDALFVVDEYGMLYKYDVATQQTVETHAIHSYAYGMAWDGEFLWIGQEGGNVYGYDLSGAPVGSFSSPVYWPAIAWDGSYFLIKEASDYAVPFYRVDYDGSVIQTFSSSYNGYANVLEWVPGHPNGEIWVNDYYTDRICQLSLETGVVTLVSEFPFYDNGIAFSLSHNGTDLWWSDSNGPLYQIDDGIIERSWLAASPESGVLPAGAFTDVEVTFDASGLFGGDYLADVLVLS
ncbi:choice-of-anchor D domain-containing protein, partial [bacterium]|nr:choice-of-anchor D domain-containing protein [bacterium]